jgi:hypothetical protein
VFFVHSLKIMPNIYFQKYQFLQITKKWHGFYIRDTEFFSKIKISFEVKIQSTQEMAKMIRLNVSI